MESWTSGILIGFIAGSCLAYFVGRFVGYTNGKNAACNWLLRNAKACDLAAKQGVYTADNNNEAHAMRIYVEHIRRYND